MFKLPFLRPPEPHERAAAQLAATRRELLDAHGDLEWAKAQVGLLEAREARLREFITKEMEDEKT